MTLYAAYTQDWQHLGPVHGQFSDDGFFSYDEALAAAELQYPGHPGLFVMETGQLSYEDLA
jgi:hypothetical protein